VGSLLCLNVGWGDASVIKTETATFLIDCFGIEDYSWHLPADMRIRSVFITHQHWDHYSGLTYLKDNGYLIDYLIYSPYERRRGDNSVTLEEWKEFNDLRDYYAKQGTKIYKPYRQDAFDKPWWDTDGVKFEIIGPHVTVADADTREIHDASLVIKAILGERNCLFAGDASGTSLECIATTANNYCNDILHASHHGSLNGSYLEFIKKCNARYTLISTKTGVYPNAPHVTALKRYKDHTKNDVRRTDIDGTWEWEF